MGGAQHSLSHAGVRLIKDVTMKAKTKILNICKAFGLPVVVWIIFAFVTKGAFATGPVLLSLLRTSVVPVLLAMGLSFGMVMGLWNFSVGAIIYACAIFSAYISESLGLGVPGLCVLSILIGVVLSGGMGVLYRVLRIPCLVLSLGFVMVVEALPGIFVPDATAKIRIKEGFLAGVPWCYLILLVMFVLFSYINSYTTLGANIKAIGADIKIANTAGINIDRIKFISFILSGLFLGVAGIVFMSANITLTGVVGFASAGMLFDGMMGIFVAFVLEKYINYNVAVLIGTVTIRILSAGLVASGLSSEMRGMLTGAFLLVVVAYSANAGLIERMQARKQVVAKANAEV